MNRNEQDEQKKHNKHNKQEAQKALTVTQHVVVHDDVFPLQNRMLLHGLQQFQFQQIFAHLIVAAGGRRFPQHPLRCNMSEHK